MDCSYVLIASLCIFILSVIMLPHIFRRAQKGGKGFLNVIYSHLLDSDGDGIRDNVDTDDDNDGTPDEYDVLPYSSIYNDYYA